LSGASALTLAVLAILHGAPARAADAAVEKKKGRKKIERQDA